MDYFFLKHLHVTLVALSVLGFALRWSAGLAGARWTEGRVARTVPHVLDSALLLSGLLLVASWGAALGPWFTAKMVGLLLYVLLGVVSLRQSASGAMRLLAGLAALAVVGWMMSVAITKQAWGFFSGF